MISSKCPLCNNGFLIEHTGLDIINYKNTKLSVDLEYSICDNCHEELILPEQIKRNDIAIQNVWRINE